MYKRERTKPLISITTTTGDILTHIMPLLMMRQQRVPRAKWRLLQTDRGKKWIERVCGPGCLLGVSDRQLMIFVGRNKDAEGMHPSRHLNEMMGYATCSDHNMVVMTGAQGKRHQVVNIGLCIKRIAYEGPSVNQWAQSLSHKVGPRLLR